MLKVSAVNTSIVMKCQKLRVLKLIIINYKGEVYTRVAQTDGLEPALTPIVSKFVMTIVCSSSV